MSHIRGSRTFSTPFYKLQHPFILALCLNIDTTIGFITNKAFQIIFSSFFKGRRSKINTLNATFYKDIFVYYIHNKSIINNWLFQQNYQLRSEEHTSELQSRFEIVCRLLLEKKKRKKISTK